MLFVVTLGTLLAMQVYALCKAAYRSMLAHKVGLPIEMLMLMELHLDLDCTIPVLLANHLLAFPSAEPCHI